MNYLFKHVFGSRECSSSLNSYDIVLHIGAPKTGTSALQNFFINNQSSLLNHGFYYPDHGLDRNGISGGHGQLSVPLIEDDLERFSAVFERLLREAKEKKSCLLLSSEGFYGQYTSFAPFLKGLKVQVVGWFRHPFEAFISNYNQSVKRHYQKISINKALSKELYKTQEDYLNGIYLHGWADSIGVENCSFFPYLYSLDGGVESIEFNFLKILGVENRYFKRFKIYSKSVNRSYLPEALELKRLINFILKDANKKLSQKIDWAMQHYTDESVIDGKSTVIDLIECDKVFAVLNYFRKSNFELAQRFPEMKTLFELESIYLKQADHAGLLGLDLLAPWRHLLGEYPEAAESIRNLVVDGLSGSVNPPYPILKIADIIGLNYEEVDKGSDVFTDKFIDIMVSKESQSADLLREVALALERYGDNNNALRVISRALELRPQGPVIIKTQERLSEKVKTNEYN